MSHYRSEFLSDHYYHVYNRGYMKQILFYTDRDYQKFISFIDQYIVDYPMINISVYCILPNHFHFLLQQTRNGLYISEFMRRVQGAYANYYKVKYHNIRGIPIYEGRYRAKPIETMSYLLDCYQYILNNPIKHNLVDTIDKRPYLFLKRPVSNA